MVSDDSQAACKLDAACELQAHRHMQSCCLQDPQGAQSMQVVAFQSVPADTQPASPYTPVAADSPLARALSLSRKGLQQFIITMQDSSLLHRCSFHPRTACISAAVLLHGSMRPMACVMCRCLVQICVQRPCQTCR